MVRGIGVNVSKRIRQPQQLFQSSIKMPVSMSFLSAFMIDVNSWKVLFENLNTICSSTPVIWGGIATQVARGDGVLREQDLDILVPFAKHSAHLSLLLTYIEWFMCSHKYIVFKRTSSRSKHSDSILYFIHADTERIVKFEFLKPDFRIRDVIRTVDLTCCQAWVDLEKFTLECEDPYTIEDILRGHATINPGLPGHMLEASHEERIAKYTSRGFQFSPLTFVYKDYFIRNADDAMLFIKSCRSMCGIPDTSQDVRINVRVCNIFNTIEESLDRNHEHLKVGIKYVYCPSAEKKETIEVVSINTL